jgi:uncharacterized protein (DUF4415 family)
MNNHPNPEWTDAMLSESKTAMELFPQLIQRNNKITATIEYDADIISAFRASGNDWQARMNDALRQWLNEHVV